MARTFWTITFALAAILTGFYQFQLKPKLAVVGVGRVIESIGNSKCKTYKDVQACEKIVLHQPSGHLYMACSTQTSRVHWIPAVGRLNATGKSSSDYVAVFDPVASKITRLQTNGFKYPRGLSVHGMDVVQSKYHPSDILIYLINHREPFAPAKAEEVGADSVIEIFKTNIGSTEMSYLTTFKHPVIATPNDIVGTGDDKSFYFTNDHGLVKTRGRFAIVKLVLNGAAANIGYCHAEDGCKVAIDGLQNVNGITRDGNGVYYAGSSILPELYVLERQGDDTLVVTDIVRTDRPIDNLSVDRDGAVWGAGIPKGLHTVYVHFANPNISAPSSALRFSLNKDQSQYFGEKYEVKKMFEDDGTIASGSTSVVYDVQRKKLYLHGISAPHLTVCDL